MLCILLLGCGQYFWITVREDGVIEKLWHHEARQPIWVYVEPHSHSWVKAESILVGKIHGHRLVRSGGQNKNTHSFTLELNLDSGSNFY